MGKSAVGHSRAGRRTVVCVVGTRPEAIKMMPVIRALKTEDWARCILVVTAQHRDLLDQMLSRFRLSSDYDLDLMTDGQQPTDLLVAMLPALDRVLVAESAEAVLAQGDTTTVLGAALAAFHRCLPFGHVEAGLRTYDLQHPFPEEGYRQMVSRIARWHFAPTPRAADALRAEGVGADAIHVTGNTGVDALRQTVNELPPLSPSTERLILLTAHRRESFGEPLREVFRAVRQVALSRENLRIVYPVHPNPNVQKAACELLGNEPRIQLVAPLDYFAFVDLMRRATLIVTDSGGIQEEAPALGKPVLVLRESTERPEAVQLGHAQVVGTSEAQVVDAITGLLDNPGRLAAMSRFGTPFGDGHAAPKIVRVLERALNS